MINSIDIQRTSCVQLSTVNYDSWSMTYELWAMKYELKIELSSTKFEIWAMKMIDKERKNQ